jgi:branched-chain amino acid transport system permease protein
MAYFLQVLFTGLSIGSIYALVSLGFVLLIRAADVVNFAQGQFAMVSAYLLVLLTQHLSAGSWIAIPIVIVAMALFGVVFMFATYWPLRFRSSISVVIATIGASIFLENLVLLVAGPEPQRVNNLVGVSGFRLGNIFMGSQHLVIIATTVVLVALQYYIFERTLFGKKLQAVSQDKETAALIGIPVAFTILFTFGYSAVIGGIAGVLVAPVLFVSVQMGNSIVLKAFAANIIGGYGSIPGAICGGLLLGLVETIGAAYVSITYKDAIAFGILLLFLVLRPSGLFGEKVAEKA